MTDVVGHYLVFTVSAIAFLLLPLLIGYLVRPSQPNFEKKTPYECGEPTIGSSYIQFDLRFYVVALLFIIFDVEVVFFFPWATVFGNAMQLADVRLSPESREILSAQLLSGPTGDSNIIISPQAALTLGWMSFVDVLVFFGILLVGFAYVWKRGDLDWVRSTVEQKHRTGTTFPVSHQTDKKPAAVTAS